MSSRANRSLLCTVQLLLLVRNRPWWLTRNHPSSSISAGLDVLWSVGMSSSRPKNRLVSLRNMTGFCSKCYLRICVSELVVIWCCEVVSCVLSLLSFPVFGRRLRRSSRGFGCGNTSHKDLVDQEIRKKSSLVPITQTCYKNIVSL